ncbi:unnamed protein product, partial [Brenthis ino]
MTLKLITVNDVKITLQPGEHVFGRKKFFDADDRRVHREHGQLQVNTETIVLKSLHKNPCYFKKYGSTECEILKQDNSVTLRNGDKFGLIPEMDKLWYEVMYIPDTEDKERKNLEKENNNKVRNSIPQEENAEINNETNTNNDTTAKNNDTTLCNNTTENQQAHTTSDKLLSILNEDETSSSTIPECQNENESRENNSSPQMKRSHSDENGSEVDLKKAKIEEQLDDTKQSTSDQASTSNNGVDRKPPNPLRERCMYGANCYRKNPSHMAQFSHPRDADWGAGARGLCPYGAACAKRDPRHWRDHDHPPGAAPPAPGQPRDSKIVERHGNVFIINAHTVNFFDDHFQVTDSEGDSRRKRNKADSLQNMIVIGKRPRKPLQRDVLSDSDAEEDPYATDESDEWQPDSGSQDFSEDYF